jgi:hypothetical protein
VYRERLRATEKSQKIIDERTLAFWRNCQSKPDKANTLIVPLELATYYFYSRSSDSSISTLSPDWYESEQSKDCKIFRKAICISKKSFIQEVACIMITTNKLWDFSEPLFLTIILIST